MDDLRPQQLYLSPDDKRITGLCGGIAEYFDTDASLVRLGWIVFTILTGIVPGMVAYIIASIVVPKKPAEHGGSTNNLTNGK